MPEELENKNSNDQKINGLLELGAEMIGAAAGGVSGFFLAGPEGAAAAGVGGVAISKGLAEVVIEMKNRLLGKREEKRMGATMVFAIQKIQENLKSKVPREDSFFEGDIKDRSSSEEIFEATLMAAQRDPEEKKLKYYGNLLGNIPFEASIDRSHANHLIKIAQDLSWSQLCLLAISARKGLFNLKAGHYRGQSSFPQQLVFLLSQMVDLHSKGLVNFGRSAVLGITDVNPEQMTAQGVGAHLYNLMELVEIPTQELARVANSLSE